MQSLGLNYDIVWLGESESVAYEVLLPRLEAGLPTIFYLWMPHQILSLYNLSRISLPAYNSVGFAGRLTKLQ